MFLKQTSRVIQPNYLIFKRCAHKYTHALKIFYYLVLYRIEFILKYYRITKKTLYALIPYQYVITEIGFVSLKLYFIRFFNIRTYCKIRSKNTSLCEYREKKRMKVFTFPTRRTYCGVWILSVQKPD